LSTRRIFVRIVAAFLLGLTLTPQVALAQKSITVFAAASLTDTLQAVADAYKAKNGSRVVLSFGASSTLARQIEQGAPADIFFSADTDWMDYLQKQNMIDVSSRKTLLGNDLVLIGTPQAKQVEIGPQFQLAKALGGGKLALADPASVPAGKYAKAALTSLGVWDSVVGQVVPAQDVRAALEYVARGEAPYGIVYATDARVAPNVKVVGTFPPNSHPSIVYPVALTKTAFGDARDFLVFLTGPQARAIFAKAGFRPL
jgi:molybdate transport system substrate-binding protein